jgi:hypothetical protein
MCDQAFPDRDGWFSEFYAESRTWIATPPWFRSWVQHEQKAPRKAPRVSSTSSAPISPAAVNPVPAPRRKDGSGHDDRDRADVGLS